MSNCPSCHAPLSKMQKSCPECGWGGCPGCGKPLAAGAFFCPNCGEELSQTCVDCGRPISRAATFCSECGNTVGRAGSIIVPEYTRIGFSADKAVVDAYSGSCPRCSTELFIEDGYCPECGQALCTACGAAVDDGDDVCNACGVTLFFSCPLCGFELTAGTEMCPDCDALFPGNCGYCGETVQAPETACRGCGRPVTIQRRQSARTVRTFLVNRRLVRMVVCPGCGRHLNPSAGPCGYCQARVCAECQLILQADESNCPRCEQAAYQESR